MFTTLRTNFSFHLIFDSDLDVQQLSNCKTTDLYTLSVNSKRSHNTYLFNYLIYTGLKES